MGLMKILMLLLISNLVYSSDESRAISAIMRATPKTTYGKKFVKSVEDQVDEHLIIDKSYLPYIGAAVSASQGRVSTDTFSNIKIQKNNMSIKPSIDYRFKEKIVDSSIIVDWRY